ncbi:hypothetical protein BJ741DRAFT_593646 [Chytriomyces cf. hyalinus JEL632]|nr:hypothetical protein BJ741DRAFT_593646 [Chytriomyces cf. hyalinus JEL632]
MLMRDSQVSTLIKKYEIMSHSETPTSEPTPALASPPEINADTTVMHVAEKAEQPQQSESHVVEEASSLVKGTETTQSEPAAASESHEDESIGIADEPPAHASKRASLLDKFRFKKAPLHEPTEPAATEDSTEHAPADNNVEAGKPKSPFQGFKLPFIKRSLSTQSAELSHPEVTAAAVPEGPEEVATPAQEEVTPEQDTVPTAVKSEGKEKDAPAKSTKKPFGGFVSPFKKQADRNSAAISGHVEETTAIAANEVIATIAAVESAAEPIVSTPIENQNADKRATVETENEEVKDENPAKAAKKHFGAWSPFKRSADKASSAVSSQADTTKSAEVIDVVPAAAEAIEHHEAVGTEPSTSKEAKELDATNAETIVGDEHAKEGSPSKALKKPFSGFLASFKKSGEKVPVTSNDSTTVPEVTVTEVAEVAVTEVAEEATELAKLPVDEAAIAAEAAPALEFAPFPSAGAEIEVEESTRDQAKTRKPFGFSFSGLKRSEKTASASATSEPTTESTGEIASSKTEAVIAEASKTEDKDAQILAGSAEEIATAEATSPTAAGGEKLKKIFSNFGTILKKAAANPAAPSNPADKQIASTKGEDTTIVEVPLESLAVASAETQESEDKDIHSAPAAVVIVDDKKESVFATLGRKFPFKRSSGSPAPPKDQSEASGSSDEEGEPNASEPLKTDESKSSPADHKFLGYVRSLSIPKLHLSSNSASAAPAAEAAETVQVVPADEIEAVAAVVEVPVATTTKAVADKKKFSVLGMLKKTPKSTVDSVEKSVAQEVAVVAVAEKEEVAAVAVAAKEDVEQTVEEVKALVAEAVAAVKSVDAGPAEIPAVAEKDVIAQVPANVIALVVPAASMKESEVANEKAEVTKVADPKAEVVTDLKGAHTETVQSTVEEVAATST